MRDPRRWLIPVVLVSFVAMWALNRSGPRLVGSEGAECLTHSQCASTLRCFAVFKDGDPFARPGQCSAICTDDLQCPSGFHCQKTVKGDGQSWLPGTRKVTEAAESLCRK